MLDPPLAQSSPHDAQHDGVDDHDGREQLAPHDDDGHDDHGDGDDGLGHGRQHGEDRGGRSDSVLCIGV